MARSRRDFLNGAFSPQLSVGLLVPSCGRTLITDLLLDIGADGAQRSFLGSELTHPDQSINHHPPNFPAKNYLYSCRHIQIHE